MFSFEKEMSCRLLEVGTRRLQDVNMRGTQHNEEQDWGSLFKSIVLAMVRRGEFDVVINKLAELLSEVFAENKRVLSNNIPHESTTEIDCFLTILEALNVAFTQNLIHLKLLNSDTLINHKPLPLRSIIQWGMIKCIPPLEPETATSILNICMDVLPREYVEVPISSSVGIRPRFIIGNAILTICQYIFISNPLLVVERMRASLADENITKNIAILCLGCSNVDSFIDYMQLIRNSLPKLKLKMQVDVMLLVCGSLCRSIIADSSMSFMDDHRAIVISKSLGQWVEKLRAFKPLRNLRVHEAVLTSLLDLQRMALAENGELGDEHLNASVINAPANKLFSYLAHNQKSPSDSDFSSKASNEKSDYQDNFLSLAHTKTFEKVKSIIKREAANEKKSQNYISACWYLSIVGFVGWAASNSPMGKRFHGVALDVLPYATNISEICYAIPKRSRILFYCYCANFNSSLFTALVPTMEGDAFLETMRTIQVYTHPKLFQSLISDNCDSYVTYFSQLVNQFHRIDLCAALEMLININPQYFPMNVAFKVMNILCNALKDPPLSLDRVEHLSLFEKYIEKLYEKIHPLEPSIVNALSMLLPDGNVASSYYKAHKIQNLYLYLKLVARGRAVIPNNELQNQILGRIHLQSTRTFLMLSFCVEESIGIAETALKCLELMQGEAYQSATQRDLISELLDSIEHENPSIVLTQARMCKYLARSVDDSFLDLNRAVTGALELFPNDRNNEKPPSNHSETSDAFLLTERTQTNLLMVKAATISLEPFDERNKFYSSMFHLNSTILASVCLTEPKVSFSVAFELYDTFRRHFEELRFEKLEQVNLLDRAIMFYWAINILLSSQAFHSNRLNLGELCNSYMILLNSTNYTVKHEDCVLKLIKICASYVSGDPNGNMKEFDSTIQAMMNRTWLPGTEDAIKSALSAVLENYKASDDHDLILLAVKVSEFMGDEVKAVPLITSLLRKNIKNVIHLCDKALSLNPICRACSYDALALEISSKVDQNSALFDKTEMVTFLLNHAPILEAFCDVCSVAGNDTLWPALLELFSSYSASAERNLIKIAFKHEVCRTNNQSELLRSNSMTMRIIIEWMRVQAYSYLKKVVSPILGSLRSASLRNYSDLDIIFSDSLIRYELLALPAKITWALEFLKEIVEKKFDEDIAESCISNLLCVRFICPAILSPHKYGLTSRAPAQSFALVLRKYAIFLQNRRDQLKNSLLNNNPKWLNGCASAEEIEFELDLDKSARPSNIGASPNIESFDEYTSATRHVFHLLRRHAVEIKMVLQTRGHHELVNSMMRYLRLGKAAKLGGTTRVKISDVDFGARFKGRDVLVVTAQNLCSDRAIIPELLSSIREHPVPLLIDFTDFIGITDHWSEVVGEIVFPTLKNASDSVEIIGLNCPGVAIDSLFKVASQLPFRVDMAFTNSVELQEDVNSIPPSLTLARMAAEDMKLAVAFEANVNKNMTEKPIKTQVYIGTHFLQFKMQNGFEVVPYVATINSHASPLALSVRNRDIYISCGGIEFLISEFSPAMIRFLQFNLDASQATTHGARIDMNGDTFSHAEKHDYTGFNASKQNSTSNPSNISDKSTTPTNSRSSIKSSFTESSFEDDYTRIEELDTKISPGKLLYSTLLDIMHPSEIVRKKAVSLYAALHDTFSLQLNVPSLRESHKPSQVYSLAAAAAIRHPKMAMSVAIALASLGIDITEAAVRVAAPWIPYVELSSPKKKQVFRKEVIERLLCATLKSPKIIGGALLEYFWPNLRDMPNAAADLLLDAMKNADPEAREAIRQIAANGIPLSRPHESQKLAEVTLARLYRSLRTNEMLHARNFSDHDEWHDIYNYALLFGSIPLDYRAAEALFADMGFVLFTFARVGDFHLRNTIYDMLINYLSSLLQSPHLSPSQSQRLRCVRTELNSNRCLTIFGLNNDFSEPNMIESLDEDLQGFTPDMADYFGRILWETIIGVFGANLNKYQDARAAVASRIMEFVDILWPPLQRRCILGLIGAVKFYMPEKIVAKLLEVLHSILAVEGTSLCETQVELVNCIMRMFSETIECIPETGKYQMHFFWVAVIALGTSSEPLMSNAVRLLLKSVKIEQLRGAFNDENIADVFLRACPSWIGEIKPHILLDIPSSPRNFHLALSQLLLRPFLRPESSQLTLQCFNVLAKACPSCILYTVFIFLGGKNEWLISRVPTGTLVDTNDTVLQWIINKLKNEDQVAVMSLGYAAYVSAYTECPNFAEVAQRTMSIVERIDNRRVVSLVSPLLRPAFMRLLQLHDFTVEIRLVEWTSKIFSSSMEERTLISKEENSLKEILDFFELSPCFDRSLRLVPFPSSKTFTNDARLALGSGAWLTSLSSPSSPLEDKHDLF